MLPPLRPVGRPVDRQLFEIRCQLVRGLEGCLDRLDALSEDGHAFGPRLAERTAIAWIEGLEQHLEVAFVYAVGLTAHGHSDGGDRTDASISLMDLAITVKRARVSWRFKPMLSKY